MDPSTPSMSTQAPAVASSMGMRYRAWYTHSPLTVFTAQSSSSSGEYASPSTRTFCPFFSVPLITRPRASNDEQSFLG